MGGETLHRSLLLRLPGRAAWDIQALPRIVVVPRLVSASVDRTGHGLDPELSVALGRVVGEGDEWIDRGIDVHGGRTADGATRVVEGWVRLPKSCAVRVGDVGGVHHRWKPGPGLEHQLGPIGSPSRVTHKVRLTDRLQVAAV